MSTQLITAGGLSVAIDSPEDLKAEALESSALIARVRNEQENAAAVEAQTKLKSVLKVVEDSRKAVKQPVLDLSRKIDETAKTFIADLKAEEVRLGKLVGNFQQLEIARLKSAEAARIAGLSDLEKRREEELAQATTLDERDTIQAHYNDEARAQSVAQPVRATGQVVKEDFEIEVTDPSLLARCHYPELCRVEPKLGVIKEAIRSGRTVYGVTAKPIVKASVRLGKQEAVIVV